VVEFNVGIVAVDMFPIVEFNVPIFPVVEFNVGIVAVDMFPIVEFNVPIFPVVEFNVVIFPVVPFMVVISALLQSKVSVEKLVVLKELQSIFPLDIVVPAPSSISIIEFMDLVK
jgi:hypothetical protein